VTACGCGSSRATNLEKPVILPVLDNARGTNGPAPNGQGAGESPGTAIVTYGAMNWIGEFTCKPGVLERCGQYVVVQTDRGIELGRRLTLCPAGPAPALQPEQVRRYVQASGPEFCRPNAGRLLRPATPQDIEEHRRLNARTREDIEQCAALAQRLGLQMKVVTAEHLLGGERIVFYFRADGRVDFRELVKELARRYHTRIEMRQVGARDEARLVADWEICGRECCCRTFLKKLRPVSMKMAKLQKSTLDPSKVSGRCGRLRCCLRYEHEGYQELAARLPRRGTRVRTAFGEGTVIDHQILTQLVLVRSDSLQEYAVPVSEILEFNLPAPAAAATTETVVPPQPIQDDSKPDELEAEFQPSETQPTSQTTEPSTGAEPTPRPRTEKRRRRRRRRNANRRDSASGPATDSNNSKP
jgi:cell fate regulator YaaT (PSP1 superfamily)